MTQQRENRRLFIRLALVAAGMFGFGYALVPFYYQICAAWGVNLVDKPSTVENTQVDKSRLVTIELDESLNDRNHLCNVVRRFGVKLGVLNSQEAPIVMKDCCNRCGNLADRDAALAGSLDNLVVDVGEVHHLENLPTA